MPAIVASATPAPQVRPVGWTVTLVNMERRDAAPGGELPLCQAIAPTVLAVHLRYRRAGEGTTVRLRVSVPGQGQLVRRLRLRNRRGRLTAAFTARGLRDDAFPPGRYVARVGSGPRGTLRLGGGPATC